MKRLVFLISLLAIGCGVDDTNCRYNTLPVEIYSPDDGLLF